MARNNLRYTFTLQQQEHRKNNACPICGLNKSLWKLERILRGTNCCSVECTSKYSKECVLFWPEFRLRVFKRDNYICKSCQNKFEKDNQLIADHIKPIKLGGEQWELENLQTLCIPCNKEKTRKDISNISKFKRDLRRKDGVLKII